MRVPFAACSAVLFLSVATPAFAVDPFEVQIYEGDINDPGHAGLELHTNYTAVGRKMESFAGEAVPHRMLRMTLEPSFAPLRWWELGAYLQTAFATADPAAHWAGFKLRSKFILPREYTGDFIFGINFEVGRGVAALGSDEWDTEVRPIVAWTRGPWMVAVNPIVGWALSGPLHAAPDFEPGAKVRFDTRRGVGVGVEYFAGLGLLSKLSAVKAQEHYVYLVADLLDGPFDLNVGLGRGVTGISEDWTVKTILGFGF